MPKSPGSFAEMTPPPEDLPANKPDKPTPDRKAHAQFIRSYFAKDVPFEEAGPGVATSEHPDGSPQDGPPPNPPAKPTSEGKAHARFMKSYFAKDVPFEETASGAATARTPAASPPAGGSAIDYRDTRRVNAPAQVLEKQRVVSRLTHHELADTFRILRTRVLHRMDAHGFRTLAITSPSRGDGKTLTAVNLAVSLAANPTRTVLLVDTDLRMPRVHEHFGLPMQPGLQDCLAGDAALADCLVHPEIDRLVILPAGGEPIPSSSDLLATPAMTALAEELRTRYADRIIIYDLPPLLASDDAMSFLKHVDCCLIAVAEGKTRKRAFEHALELLEGCTVLGTVLNHSTEPPLAPYEYYQYSNR